MAFTGATLSQALEGAGWRVVLCASMVPLGAGRDVGRIGWGCFARFGTGTIMNDAGISAALSQAVERGVQIRAVSQCEVGSLEPGAYAAGAQLWGAGVQNGGRETPEAALIHLWLN